MRNRILLAALTLAVLTLPVAAGTKEQLIEIQTQMRALQDQMGRMQQSFDERMGVMRNLVEQTSDGVNKMSVNVATLEKSLHQQSSDSVTKVDQVSTQVQALQDSVDELKSRINKLAKQLEDMQAAKQDLVNPVPTGTGTQGTPDAAAQAPPPDTLYNNALRDYVAAKYDLAEQEFGDYMKFYANTELAGNAQYYLADIHYRKGDYENAVKEYDKVIEQYPGGNKTPAAQLKKGYALIELNHKKEGIATLQNLVGRYPKSMEANQAREKLRKLGASTAGKPTPQ